eukprot:scaffold13126_cov175-Amphora_coffeaeformis.AAC.5
MKPKSLSRRALPQRRQSHHRVALISDFVYPRLGGVENHIWSLAQELLQLGHKVIVITHAYKGYKGVHYFSFPRRRDIRHHHHQQQSNDNNDKINEDLQLKVYYCPIVPMTDEDALPTFTATFPLLRWILIREQIEIVHAHQATSTLANESIVYAGILGLATVYTDHSLFSLHDVAGVILNRVLTTTLATVDAAICVSRACRDNFILRTRLQAQRVFVVPNAVDATKFQPAVPSTMKNTNTITNNNNNHNDNKTAKPVNNANRITTDRVVVVVVSRLAYRKGVDLLVGIIPEICRHHAQVDFIIAGDGPKRLALQEMVEAERLQERVHFRGAVPHEQVRDVLVEGQIFLNCSLTESFCIAILEASCAGLTVVSTNVGGIPEVLEEGVQLADPNVPDMVRALQHVIHQLMETGPENPWPRHERLAQRYAWHKVAEETVHIYDRVRNESRKTFLERLECYLLVGGGGMTGLVVAWLAVSFELFSRLVAWQQPIRNIDILPDTQKAMQR